MSTKSELRAVIDLYRPYTVRTRGPIYHALFPTAPNKSTTIYERVLESYRYLDSKVHFLAGMLVLLPHLNLKRGVQLQDDGEKLIVEAHRFMMAFPDPS